MSQATEITTLFLEVGGVLQDNPDTANLMIEQPFTDILRDNRGALFEMLRVAAEHEIAVPDLASVLACFDAYRTRRLPANLIQAQRDCFGSYTDERVTK